VTGHVLRKRKGKDDPYARIAKTVVNNGKLSWEARGMLAYLLGKPDDWTISFWDLVNHSPSGAHKTRRILKELELEGYVKRDRKQDRHGVYYWESGIYEDPYWFMEPLDLELEN